MTSKITGMYTKRKIIDLKWAIGNINAVIGLIILFD